MHSLFYRTIAPQLRWEGDVRPPERIERAAVIAQFSTTSCMTKSFNELVREIAAHDYFVIISSACTDSRPLEFEFELPRNVAILRKPNIGYDFGSWAAAIGHAPQVLEADQLLQVNDSLIGPFWSLAEVLDHFDNDAHDWWGMIRSNQITWHYQSHFVGYKREVLQSTALRDYWASVRVHTDKWDIIKRYEYGLSTRMYNEGFVGGAFIEPARVANPGMNPMIDGWYNVLKAGAPFVKRELLTRPEVVPLGERAPEILRSEFNIEVTDWV